MGEVIAAKRQAFKVWKTGKGTRASYHAAIAALPDVQCIMLAKKLTRRSTRILTQSLQNYSTSEDNLEPYLPNKVVSRCLRHSVHLLTLLASCL